MKKIKKLVKALGLILKQPALLNKIIDDEGVNKTEVTQKYDLPNGLPTVNITDLLPNFHVKIASYSALEGGSTPIDIGLLKSLAASIENCRYFEIGTWRGESVTNVASVAQSCVTVNLPDAEMTEMGIDQRYIDSHRLFSKDLSNVTHLQANSQTFDFSSLNQQFDLLFIDGDHHYESVKKDTQTAFSLLANDDSIIVWHDYGNNPTDIRWDVLKGILEGTPIDKRMYLYRVSNTLCAIYTTKPMQGYYPLLSEKPKRVFEMEITSLPVVL